MICPQCRADFGAIELPRKVPLFCTNCFTLFRSTNSGRLLVMSDRRIARLHLRSKRFRRLLIARAAFIRRAVNLRVDCVVETSFSHGISGQTIPSFVFRRRRVGETITPSECHEFRNFFGMSRRDNAATQRTVW